MYVYLYICVCGCRCVNVLVCVRRRRFITVKSACGKLTRTSPTYSPCCFATSPSSPLPYARYNLLATQANVIFSLSFPPPQPNLLPSCSVPVPFVIDSLLSKLVSIDFQLVVFVVAAKILIDSISNRRYFLQQWGNVIRKCFRH